MSTVDSALREARRRLAAAGIDSAALDARLLLADAAKLEASALIAGGRDPLSEAAARTFERHLARRLAGEPVARILGEKEFWGLSFALNHATLVPRPETETLLEAALAEARALERPDISICDLGTGSGAIAIALLSELPAARGVATDISADALAIARANAARHGVATRLTLVEADFAEGPAGPFDIVVSNPPYVRSGDIAGLDPAVRDHDPRLALDGGADGLAAFRRILARAPALCGEAGVIIFEAGANQREAVATLCRAAGFGALGFRSDLAGRDRVIVARRAGKPKKPLGNRPAKG